MNRPIDGTADSIIAVVLPLDDPAMCYFKLETYIILTQTMINIQL